MMLATVSSEASSARVNAQRMPTFIRVSVCEWRGLTCTPSAARDLQCVICVTVSVLEPTPAVLVLSLPCLYNAGPWYDVKRHLCLY